MSIIMTLDEAETLGRKVLSFSTAQQASVAITHMVRGVSRIANNTVLSGDDGEMLAIAVHVRIGKRDGVTVTINQRDDVSLKMAVSRAELLANQQAGPAEDLEYVPIGRQEYIPVNIWRDVTASALTQERHQVIPRLIDTVNSSGLQGAAFVGGIARTRAVLRKDGLVALDRETDIECTVTARSIGDGGSGWAGQATRDWRKLDPVATASRAIQIAKNSSTLLALEPGRRTAILSPTAVAQMARAMAYAYLSDHVYNGNSPLADPEQPAASKLNQQVFDRRLDIMSDPSDPLGGYTPFWLEQVPGIPLKPVKWVERGILKSLAYSVSEALLRGRQHHMPPQMVHIAPVSGTTMLTVEQMIDRCQEGIFVNRFSGLSLQDMKTGIVTGTTRDGCFLIQNGRITKALKNFTITESPFLALNRIEAIGEPERAALGFIKPSGSSISLDDWPLPPVIVPPLMIRDFNFSGMSDAV